MSSFKRSAVLGLVLTASFAPAAYGFDPTGTWVGTQNCIVEDLTGGTTKLKDEISFEISVDGQSYEGSIIASSAGSTSVFGTLLPSARKPDKGVMSMTACPISITTSATGRFTVKTDAADGSGKLKALLLVAYPGGIGTCKIAVRRTSTVDPNVSAPCLP